ncbi:hypothetical protein MP228_000182 [Amoeboaphelidium protococcarum]|nr:hypothetical protein MP228_000182 [Amoeboaphelidium protococcarum]
MIAARSVTELRGYLKRMDPQRTKRRGFAPTMGALHQGHIKLINKSRGENDITISSIFVNPSQFAPHEDLDKYPRTLDTDLAMLQKAGCDLVLIPPVTDIYPSGISLRRQEQVGTFIEVLGVQDGQEGAVRPHFFRGVATVVMKLLNAVDQPDNLYLGQKDYQQYLVVKNMVRDLLLDDKIKVNCVETEREQDGLAMSSRNKYLSAEERKIAPVLYRALISGQEAFMNGASSTSDLLAVVQKYLQSQSGIEIQYVNLSNADTLQSVTQNLISGERYVLSGAIKLGQTRLIDNLILQRV